MISNNRGGRGNKAEHPTNVRRIPIEINAEIDRLITELYERTDRNVVIPFSYLPTLEEMIVITEEVLKHKKSARQTINLLLSKLYAYYKYNQPNE